MAGPDPTKSIDETDSAHAPPAGTIDAPDGAEPALELPLANFDALVGGAAARFEETIREAAESLMSQVESVTRTADSAETIPMCAADPVPGPPPAAPADTSATAIGAPGPVTSGSDPERQEDDARLANAVSREVRSTLDEIVGLLKALNGVSLSAAQKQRYMAAQSAVAALESTVETVLDAAAIETDDFEPEHREFEIREALKPWVSLAGKAAAQRGLNLICDVDPRVPDRGLGDVERMKRLFFYVISYAMRFAREGDLMVSIALVSDEDEVPVVKIGARNDGAGMAPEQTDLALLRRSVQSDRSASEKDHLATVKMYRTVAEALGGGLVVEAVSTQGFEIWFAIMVPDPDTDRDDRRRPGRHETSYLSCDQGDILDLSTGGMRIMSRRLLKDEVDVHLFVLHYSLRLRAAVVWAKKIGFRKHEIGLRFVNLTEQQESQIEQLWLNYSQRRLD